MRKVEESYQTDRETSAVLSRAAARTPENINTIVPSGSLS